MKRVGSEFRPLLAPAAAVVCAFAVLTVSIPAVRAMFAMPLCFFLPGFSLTEAMFGRDRLPRYQVLMLALALSLVTLVLGALLLTLTAGGLTALSWSILLVSVVLASAAAVRPEGGRRLRRPRAQSSLRVSRRDVALLLLAGLVTVSAFAVSRTSRRAPNVLGYTELWMLPTESATGPTVTIGVQSQEQRRTSYLLKLSVDAGASVTKLFLKPGQLRLVSVHLPLASSGPPAFLAAVLYKVGVPAPYRTATARLPVSDSLIL